MPRTPEVQILPRRSFFGQAALSVAGLYALANVGAPAFAKPAKGGGAKADVGLLNAALGLEQEGIAVYGIAGGSGLVTPGVLKVALAFQGHHKEHAEMLVRTIERLGGKPVTPKSNDAYIAANNIGALKTEGDVLTLALKLERGATNAYLGLINPLADKELVALVARTAADEATHVALLLNATGQGIGKAYQFG